nr:hypothetical protein [Cohnella sp. WQ 127256]
MILNRSVNSSLESSIKSVSVSLSFRLPVVVLSTSKIASESIAWTGRLMAASSPAAGSSTFGS